MRKLLQVMLALGLFSLLLLPAFGTDNQVWDSVDTGELEDAAEDVLDTELTADIDLDEGLASLGETVLNQLDAVVTQATRSGALVLVIALFCSLLQALADGAGLGQGEAVSRIVGALAVTAGAMGDVSSLMTLGRETVENLTVFTRILIPVMTTTAAASGSLTGAASRQMVTLFCSNLLLTLMEGVLLPLVYLYVAACAGALATGNAGIRAVADFIRWGVQTALTWLLLLFTVYLGLSGVISGTADRAAVKVARLAISGMVPVVGGILSDATESVLAGAEILRNAIGVFGTLAVLAFCAVPFLRLGVQYLLYRLASVLTAAVTRHPVARLIGDLGGAFGLMLGMAGASALVTLISIVTTVSVAVS
ncbi:MAG: stage III sporulation protein AE [Clostridiales bacterium]|nr:stage III sporulation protein AE [Clostridiales bacterium]